MKDIIDNMIEMKLTNKELIPDDLLKYYIPDFYMDLTPDEGYNRTEEEISYGEG